MILFDITIKLPPEKSAVVLQSHLNFVEPVRVQHECIRFHILVGSQDVDTICIDQAWETKKALEGHIASEYFRVAMEAMDQTVKQPWKGNCWTA